MENPAVARSIRIIGVSVAAGVLLGLVAATLAVLPSGNWYMMLGSGPDLAAAFGILAGMVGAVYTCCNNEEH